MRAVLEYRYLANCLYPVLNWVMAAWTEARSFFGTGRSHLMFLCQAQLIEYGFLTVSWCRATIHRERVALSLVRERLMTRSISGR